MDNEVKTIDNSPKKKLPKINVRNKLWVSEYIKCQFNGSEATKKIYPNTKFPNRYAYLLLHKEHIRLELDRQLKGLVLDKDAVMKAISGLTQDRNPSIRLRALELIAKILGLFDDAKPSVSIFQSFDTRPKPMTIEVTTSKLE